MYIVIEHCNGIISGVPFIVYNEKDLTPFINGAYLIYSLDEQYNDILEGAIVSYLPEFC